MSDDERRLSIGISKPMEEWTPEQWAAVSEALRIVMEHNFSRPRPFEVEEPSDDGVE